MTRPARIAGKQVIATLLAVTVLWLASSAAFSAMPSSHGCAMPPASGGVISSIAHHAGVPCQHSEQIGCPSGTCTVTMVVQPDGIELTGAAPLAMRERLVSSAVPPGPRSSPPTPPPNS